MKKAPQGLIHAGVKVGIIGDWNGTGAAGVAIRKVISPRSLY